MCVFNDRSITAEPCCELCVLSTPNNALYVLSWGGTAEKCLAPFDDDMSRKLSISGHMMYTFLSYFLKKESHYVREFRYIHRVRRENIMKAQTVRK
jgi:hypothetical protein